MDDTLCPDGKFHKEIIKCGIIVNNMKEVNNYYRYLSRSKKGKKWIYRGQNNNKPIESSLIREINRCSRGEKGSALDIEYGLFDSFCRKMNLYDEKIPENLSIIETFSMMQHYSAPTRLVDLTYSFYIGLFFAIDGFCNNKDNYVYLWAFDAEYLRKKAEKTLKISKKIFFRPGKDDEQFLEHFCSKEATDKSLFVYQVTPERANPRLGIQQGTFLCQGCITETFEKNIKSLFESFGEANNHIKCLRIHKNGLHEIIRELWRMNITSETLYPGLEGFSKSLKFKLFLDDFLEIYRKKRENMEDLAKEKSEPSGYFFTKSGPKCRFSLEGVRGDLSFPRKERSPRNPSQKG